MCIYSQLQQLSWHIQCQVVYFEYNRRVTKQPPPSPAERQTPEATASSVANVFLPDFCTIRMVFAIVIIAELFAIVLSFYPLGMKLSTRWEELSMTSLFIQWCGLSSCAVLCIVRSHLGRFTHVQVGLISYAIILALVTLISAITYWVLAVPGFGFLDVAQWAFIGRNVLLTAIISGPILHYFYIQHLWQQKIKAEEQARFAALQARIQPHFLFNSLNTVASLIQINPDDAETAVENLADLFRVSMRESSTHHTLEQECELCQRYLQIETLRLGDRLQVDWVIDGLPMDAIIPPLLLQPLLENAIYHGIERLPEGGRVRLSGQFENKVLAITLTNPVADCQFSKHAGNRMALDNIRERIRTFYANHAKIETQCADNTYTVQLSLPYIKEYEDPDRR